jgi:glycosyltransferase involved in cell wall biosynthesis
VVAQTVRPARWVIVSDGSTDGTDDVIRKYAAQHDWIEYLRMPERKQRNFAGKAFAFMAAYERIQKSGVEYDVIANLDADITLRPGHFEFYLKKFGENPRLGCAGAPFQEGGEQYNYKYTSIEHVSGACQMFRRKAFEDIGGYKPVPLGGVDHIAVISTRMHGWKTRSYPEMPCTHHRKMGSAERNKWQIAYYGGVADYRLGSHPLWQIFRTPYQMTKSPVVVGATLRFVGYFWNMARRSPKVMPPDVEKFRRREQMARMRAWFQKALHLAPSKDEAQGKELDGHGVAG